MHNSTSSVVLFIILPMASVQNSGAIAGFASEDLQQYGSAIPCRMTGICSLNRRVRSRTDGGVGGGGREAFSYPY